MSCMRGRRGTRFSPSSWWPRPWPTRRRAGCCRPRPGCRPGWRSCWRPGRAAAPVTHARCWRDWRWRVGRWPRSRWPRSPGGPRELAAGRLLAEDTSGGEYRPRHALLAEAVAAGLLPGERAALHGAIARALAASGDDRVAEVAGHWQAAGNPAAELPARIAAAEAAERVFGYAEAAAHWQRAIELGQALPGGADAADVGGGAGGGGIGVARMYGRAIDTLDWSGAGVR